MFETMSEYLLKKIYQHPCKYHKNKCKEFSVSLQTQNFQPLKKKVCLLGSTGSMGVQSLEVIDELSDLLEVEVLACYSNADLLIRQAKKFKPNAVVIIKEDLYTYVKDALWDDDIKVFAGESSLCDIVEMSSIDIVLSCIVGVAGLKPVYRAIDCGKPIALANKETLVVAGELMTRLAGEKRVPLLPVDSEHSAIFRENHHHRFGRTLPGQKARLLEKCDQRAGTEAPQLEHGQQNHHRQRHPDEQGTGGDRSQMAV